jgi:hypothetical protein
MGWFTVFNIGDLVARRCPKQWSLRMERAALISV